MVDDKDLDRLQLILQELPKDSLVVFSGSLTPGISLKVFGNILKSCVKCGLIVTVDVSGPALKIAARKNLFLIKPNIEELSQYVGKPLINESQLIAVAQQNCSKVKNVLISMGAQGAILISQSAGIIKASCPSCRKEIINTVGCGDVLLGSFIGMLSHGNTFDQCLKKAVANASACAFHPIPGVFDSKLAEEFYKSINITRIQV